MKATQQSWLRCRLKIDRKSDKNLFKRDNFDHGIIFLIHLFVI